MKLSVIVFAYFLVCHVHGSPDLRKRRNPTEGEGTAPEAQTEVDYGDPGTSSENPPSAESENSPSAASDNPPSAESENPPSAGSENLPSAGSENPPSAGSENPPSAENGNSPATETLGSTTPGPLPICHEKYDKLPFQLPPNDLNDLGQMQTNCSSLFDDFKSCMNQHEEPDFADYRFNEMDQICLDFQDWTKQFDSECLSKKDAECYTACRATKNTKNIRCKDDRCMLNCLAYDLHKTCDDPQKNFDFFYHKIFNHPEKELGRNIFNGSCEDVLSYAYPSPMVTRINGKENKTETEDKCCCKKGGAASFTAAATVALLFVAILG